MTGTVLVVGATRGLGASLAQQYLSRGFKVLGTARSASTPKSPAINWVPSIDLTEPSVGAKLASACRAHGPIDLTIISAGYLALETFEKPDWDAEIKMYTTCAIGPVFVVNQLFKEGCLKSNGGKIVLVSSEAGSIHLRCESEGGGNYGHHASKTATNMIGKLLSLDLKDKGIAVGMVHPGFMRTEMTKGVGFDKYWDQGGAITPDEAATGLMEFIDEFDMSKTGQFWAPQGPRGIGTVEETMGKDLSTPLQLPW